MEKKKDLRIGNGAIKCLFTCELHANGEKIRRIYIYAICTNNLADLFTFRELYKSNLYFYTPVRHN